ncbi:hypothetical protein MN116_004413, partial [Schistosoma mekongi]
SINDNNESTLNLCNYDVHDLCKSILHGLAELHNDEEDEEDICDQELIISPSKSLNQHKDQLQHTIIMNNTNNNTDHNDTQNTNDISAICVPLPNACRVKSPIRLLVFYFEILSELMELKDHENKCSEDNQEDLSSLLDISAGILRLLDSDGNPSDDVDDDDDDDTNNNNDNEGKKHYQNNSKNLSTYKTCEISLHALLRLQDAWISAPVVIDMLNTSNGNESNDGVANYSKELHETAKLYITRIQSALKKQMYSFKKLISNKICLVLDKPISSVEESTVANFEDLCKLVVNSSFTDELKSERQLFHSSQNNINDLSEKILQTLSELPLPIADLVQKSKKLPTLNNFIAYEKKDKVDKIQKSLLPTIDDIDDDDRWEQFYKFNHLYLSCLNTYLNEVKCFITVNNATQSPKSSVTNDIIDLNATRHSIKYPTMHLSLLDNSNLFNTNWQQEQLENIDKEREILQTNFNELSVLADFLQIILLTSSSGHPPVIKSIEQQKLWQESINQMRLISSRAFKQYTCLGFLKQIIRRPGGLWDLSNFLIELFNRLVDVSQPHKWTELELSQFEFVIHHLSHEIWIELAVINNLINDYFHKTEDIGISDWLEAWIYRLQEMYRLVINRWTEKIQQFHDNVQIQIINDWCDYVTDYIHESEMLQNQFSNSTPSSPHSHQHSKQHQPLDKSSQDEVSFAILWSLLCDSDIIQEKCNIQLEKSCLYSTRFNKTLNNLKHYLNVYFQKSIMLSCVDESESNKSDAIHQSYIPLLLKQLEYSLHSLPDEHRIFSLEVTDSTLYFTHPSDKLRVILQDLKHLRNLCERNYLLCNQSLNVIHKISLSNLNPHDLNAVKEMLRMLTTWSYGYFIIYQSVERVIRAGGVVESERYPLRTLSAYELRSEAMNMLKQKQSFIESIQFSLETIKLQMKSLSIKLYEYDINSKLIKISIKCQHLYNKLKNFYYTILQDDKLKTTKHNELPNNNLNCIIITRINEIMEFNELYYYIDQINWLYAWNNFDELNNQLIVDYGYFKLWLNYLFQQFNIDIYKNKINEIFLCQLNQLEEIKQTWLNWIKKYIWPLPFPYPKNYSWTPINISTYPSVCITSQHKEYEKSFKVICQNSTLKINHKYMNLSKFYNNHIKNKFSINMIITNNEKYNNLNDNDLHKNKLEHSMELLDANYPNVFLEEIRQLTSSSSSSTLQGISMINSTSTFSIEHITCQCNVLQQIINNRLLEIQSRLVYGDHLTLMMIEQIMYDLFEIQLPTRKILVNDSKLDKLWMHIYNQCMKYLQNGFTKCLCNQLTTDSTLNDLQLFNEFDIPGSKSFNERWKKKLQIDKLQQNTLELEKQFLFFIHLIVLFNLYETWQNIVKITGTINTPKESSVYNPALLQWILTTRPKLVEAIHSYPTIQLFDNYQCGQCLYKTIQKTLLCIDEVAVNNLFREFSNQYGCIDYLLLESINNLSDRIKMCIQKVDVYHLHLRNIIRLSIPNDQELEANNSLLKTVEHLKVDNSNTLNLLSALSRWREILMKKLTRGHNFKRRLIYFSEKLQGLVVNLKSAKNMETDDCVTIEKHLTYLHVIMDQTNKILHDLQTIEFRSSFSHSINYINLINQFIVIHQQNIVQHILYNRLNYYLAKLQNPSTITRRLLHLSQIGTENCKQIINKLIDMLNFSGLPNSFTYSNDNDNNNNNNKFLECQYLEEPLFKVNAKSPGPGGLQQLFCKLSIVDKYCTEAQGYLRQQYTLFPLESTSVNDCKEMINSDASETFLNELTNQLIMCILSPTVVKRKIQYLIDELEKLRNILSAFEDNTNEMKAFRDQLCVAVPQLTGYHLFNLTKAVDELEIWASSNLNEPRCPVVPVEKRYPELGEYIRHAGQRLMELETCLEHSREAASILIFFECESRFWSTPLSSLPGKNDSYHEVAQERGLLLQSEFKNSAVAIKLNTAWVKLTQLGDRLGRIQAGLPVRRTGENRIEDWIVKRISKRIKDYSNEITTEFSYVSADKLRRKQTNLRDALGSHMCVYPDCKTSKEECISVHRQNNEYQIVKRISKRIKDYSNEITTEFSYVSADKLRRKQTNLRDALGSHMCVYPDCKTSKEECISVHRQNNEYQLNDVNKIEWIFKKLRSFHSYLQNDFNESLHHEASKQRMKSISLSKLCNQVKYSRQHHWHNSHNLQLEYQELKNLINDLVKSEYSKIDELQEYFQSIEDLWLAREKCHENLDRCVDDNLSYLSLSISENEQYRNSTKPITTDIEDSKQYTTINLPSSNQPITSCFTTITVIPQNYQPTSEGYTIPITQIVNGKPLNDNSKLSEKQVNSSFDDEYCDDWTWRELKTHGLDPQPLIFPSSINENHIKQTTELIQTYESDDTIENNKFPDTLINKLINELSSTTSSFPKVSMDTNGENNSGIISVERKNASPIDNRTSSNLRNVEVKLQPYNNTECSDQPLKVSHKDFVIQPNKVYTEIPLLSTNLKSDFKTKYPTSEISLPNKLSSSMTYDSKITDNPVLNTYDFKIDLKPEYSVYNELDVCSEPNEIFLSNIQTSCSTPDYARLEPLNISINDNISTGILPNKLGNSKILLSTHTVNLSGENTTTENSGEQHKSKRNNITTLNKHSQTPSPSVTLMHYTMHDNNMQSEYRNIDICDSNLSTSITTTTTSNFDFLGQKLKSDHNVNGTESTKSYSPTAKVDHSFTSFSTPSPTYFSSSTLKNVNVRKTFTEIYQCHHHDSSTGFNEDNINNKSSNDITINSMCSLCNHMSNLHSLITNLQSHLLSNRQNRLSNLLPIDIESFTMTSSSISSLSTYWSPIIKEYLSIICEIKSELDSFQSLSSMIECKIIHSSEYKSMNDLLNIWHCRLHDFLCLRSSNSSTSSIDISQTRWLTLFISLIQHNEIQVECLKSVFTSLLHDIENEDNEVINIDLNINNNIDDKKVSLLQTIQDESHYLTNIQKNLPGRLTTVSKSEYLNDLKSRLFSYDVYNQQAVPLSLQQQALSSHSYTTFQAEKINSSSQTKITQIDKTFRPFTVTTAYSAHLKTCEDNDETSLNSDNHDKISFEQYLCNLPQYTTCNNPSSRCLINTTLTHATDQINILESKEDNNETNWITVRKGKIKKNRKRKFKNEESPKEQYNNSNLNHKDTCDNNVQNNQSYPITNIPDKMDNTLLTNKVSENKVDNDGIELFNEQPNLSVDSNSLTPDKTGPLSASLVFPQEPDKIKNRVVRRKNKVKSNNYLSSSSDHSDRMLSLVSESTGTNANSAEKDINELQVKLQLDEKLVHPNKSDDLSSWITLQSDSSTSVMDLNIVNGQHDEQSVNCTLKSPQSYDKQMSIPFSPRKTVLLTEDHITCPSDACSNAFIPEITSSVDKIYPMVKSEQNRQENKKNEQNWMNITTEFISKHNVDELQNRSCTIDSKDESYPFKNYNENVQKSSSNVGSYNEEMNQNILSNNKWHHLPIRPDQNNELSVLNSNNENISSEVPKSIQNELYSDRLEKELKTQSHTQTTVETFTKIVNNNVNIDMNSSPSCTSTSNEPTNYPHKLRSSKKKIRKTNRQNVNNYRVKRILTDNLEGTIEINKSSIHDTIDQSEILTVEQPDILIQSKKHSEFGNDATSHSPLTQEIPTSETPTTISLKPGSFEKYRTISAYNNTHSSNTDLSKLDTPDDLQFDHTLNTQVILASTVLINDAPFYNNKVESCSISHHPSVILTEHTNRNTCVSDILEPTDNGDCDLHLFSNESNNQEFDKPTVSLNSLPCQEEYLNGSSTDTKSYVNNQEIQLKETAKYNQNTNEQYNENSLLENNYIKQTEHKYQEDIKTANNDDQNVTRHRYHDQHSRQHHLQLEHAKPYPVYELQNVHVLRQFPRIKQHMNYNNEMKNSEQIQSDIYCRAYSSPDIFNSEGLTNHLFITNENSLKLKTEHITSTNTTREVNSTGSGTNTRNNKSQRRKYCRLLPCLLLFLLSLILFLCIFILPDCSLILPWFTCNEKQLNGEWIYSPFVLYHVRNPPF